MGKSTVRLEIDAEDARLIANAMHLMRTQRAYSPNPDTDARVSNLCSALDAMLEDVRTRL